MNATIARAKIRFGSYAALAAMLGLLAALFAEYRLPLGTALALLAFWWVRLDPVGPHGEAFDPAAILQRGRAGLIARLHRLIG